jgi:tetratricopeptide (TPR) repeat protein
MTGVDHGGHLAIGNPFQECIDLVVDDLAAARPLYERALAICERVLGPGHPHTAGSLNNLASLLQAQGDLAAARPLYERALAICERALGPEHPHTAGSIGRVNDKQQ